MADDTGPSTQAEAFQPTILLGDDDPAVVTGLSEVLGSYGYTCDHVGSWPALKDRLGSGSYDLLILEMRLGRVDLVHRFAELAGSTTAPVVFLTSEGSEADRILALEKGAASVLQKPISGREIVARVRAQLRRRAAPTHPRKPQQAWRIAGGELYAPDLISA